VCWLWALPPVAGVVPALMRPSVRAASSATAICLKISPRVLTLRLHARRDLTRSTGKAAGVREAACRRGVVKPYISGQRLARPFQSYF
jgi:hypothetical protein